MTLRRRHVPGRHFGDLAPLVDVTLMLVVFLLLTAEVVESRALPVELPTAASAQAAPRDDLQLIITADGLVLRDEVSLSDDEIRALGARGSRIILQADAACRHGRVVAVVDALRDGGAEAIFYATEDPNAVEEW